MRCEFWWNGPPWTLYSGRLTEGRFIARKPNGFPGSDFDRHCQFRYCFAEEKPLYCNIARSIFEAAVLNVARSKGWLAKAYDPQPTEQQKQENAAEIGARLDR